MRTTQGAFIFPTHTPRGVKGGIVCVVLYLQSKGQGVLRTAQSRDTARQARRKCTLRTAYCVLKSQITENGVFNGVRWCRVPQAAASHINISRLFFETCCRYGCSGQLIERSGPSYGCSTVVLIGCSTVVLIGFTCPAITVATRFHLSGDNSRDRYQNTLTPTRPHSPLL